MKKQHFFRALVGSMTLCTVLSLCGCGSSDTKSSQSASEVSVQNQNSTAESSVNEESAPSAPEKTTDDFKYQETSDGITITKFTGSKTEVDIPSEIDGKPVISIGDFCIF